MQYLMTAPILMSSPCSWLRCCFLFSEYTFWSRLCVEPCGVLRYSDIKFTSTHQKVGIHISCRLLHKYYLDGNRGTCSRRVCLCILNLCICKFSTQCMKFLSTVSDSQYIRALEVTQCTFLVLEHLRRTMIVWLQFSTAITSCNLQWEMNAPVPEIKPYAALFAIFHNFLSILLVKSAVFGY